LEVLPNDRFLSDRDSPVIQALGVLDYVLVVFKQKLGRQVCQVEELRSERMMEMMDVILIQPLQLRRCSAKSSKRFTPKSESSH